MDNSKRYKNILVMEDQHYNGDEWNKQIVSLLKLFGWIHIGDYDMDVKGHDGKNMGIDAIMQFETPLKNIPQLVVVESKRYKNSSFTKQLLEDWIIRLDKKLLNLRNSSKFYETFPIAQNCTISDTGIIAIWFSDIDEYQKFLPKYKTALQQISISTRSRKAGFNKIWVIDNWRLMRLFALQNAINDISDKGILKFVYSPRYCEDKPTERKTILSIEYMFSDIIFAEQKVEDGVHSYIFYFGDLNYKSFQLLKSAYSKTINWDKSKPIILYVYDADDEFRKIKLDIKEKIFDGFNIQIKIMQRNNNIPDKIINS